MRPYATAATLLAALLTAAPAARADDDDVPQPVSRTVIEPPSQQQPPAAPPAEAAAAPAPVPPHVGLAPRTPRSEIGFSLRIGAVESDRFLVGGSFGDAAGPIMVGLSSDVTTDVGGTRRHDHRRDEDGGERVCFVRSDGRCTRRTDVTMAGYVGLRHKTAPVFGGARLRLELAGELGWQWSFVDERLGTSGAGHDWSDASRAFPMAGVRAQVGLVVLRNATFGIGGFGRQGLSGRVCVTTDGGCTKVGGATAGVYFFGGGDWAFGG